ncbi:hypothetical protein LINPERHAP1_LOCUS8255 [Linum perenne]
MLARSCTTYSLPMIPFFSTKRLSRKQKGLELS